jgi:hypothetical protein
MKWLDILSKVQHIKLSLIDFIQGYIDYKQAFEQFPLDMPAFILLIQRIHPPKHTPTSPFIIFIKLYQQLNLQATEFFQLFQPVFSKGIENRKYEIEHISELLKRLSTHDFFFHTYLKIYSSHANTDDLWNMYLRLSKISDLNGIIKKYLTPILTTRVSGVSVEAFHHYIQTARKCLTEIESEVRPHFIEIFEKIYDSFIIKQLQDVRYSYRFSKTDLEDLLKLGLLLSSTHSIKRPSCLLIVRELLFKTDVNMKNTAEKIKYLFQNLNTFDENLCKIHDPAEIIEDEWLKDFLISNSHIWSKLDENVYKYLCDHHNNNRWIIYIWSRIIHLSLLKLINENSNETLLKLNEWMKKVKHEIYDPTDILTSIFVIKLFELVIVKQTQSLLLLPNIETIMNFVISIRNNQNPSHRINTMTVDIVIQNGKETLQKLLQLNGKSILYEMSIKRFFSLNIARSIF